MKTTNCPHCTKQPRFGYTERISISSGGKPCKNCGTLLLRPKWEPWLLGAISVFMIFSMARASELSIRKIVLFIFILVMAGSHYLAARFAPLKIKDLTKP